MAMTYPALGYQVLDFFIHLPSFSNRWNFKQNLNPIIKFVKKSLAYIFIECLSLSKMTAIEVTTRVTGTNYNCKIFFLFLINQSKQIHNYLLYKNAIKSYLGHSVITSSQNDQNSSPLLSLSPSWNLLNSGKPSPPANVQNLTSIPLHLYKHHYPIAKLCYFINS